MKKYFDFSLKGSDLLKPWIAFYIFFIVPYAVSIGITTMDKGSYFLEHAGLFFFLIIEAIIAMLVLYYFLIKIPLNHIKIGDKSVVFSGKFSDYIVEILFGFLLCIVTMGFYSPWFIKNIYKFFINKTSINSNKFSFNGTGGKLFLLLLLTCFVPIIILSIIMLKLEPQYNHNFLYKLTTQLLTIIIMTPYYYYFLKWTIDIDYHGYRIRWNGKFIDTCAEIIFQATLSIITVGIYFPLAYLKIYKFITENLVAKRDGVTRSFGYEIEDKEDFLFIWGQTLLTIITIGTYYPWALSKIGKRVSNKTYIQVVNIIED